MEGRSLADPESWVIGNYGGEPHRKIAGIVFGEAGMIVVGMSESGRSGMSGWLNRGPQMNARS